MENDIEAVVLTAVNTANDLNHEYMTVEHLTLALLQNETVLKDISKLDVDLVRIADDLDGYLHNNEYNGLEMVNGSKGNPKKTIAVERVIQRALAQVIFNGREQIEPLDLLISILGEDDSVSKYYCELNGLTKEAIQSQKQKKSIDAKSAELIQEFTTNLNEEAMKHRIDPLIGREKEVDDLVHVLARRKKNNCVLVGEPGVGKTAIAEGLAKRIIDEEVPPMLRSKVVYSLSVGDLLAGTRYRGDFEERIKQLLEILQDDEDCILFIDEIHMIMGAGSSGGSSVDIANLIKPVLGKGRLLTIGATTPDEYADSFEKDRALMRRFAKLDIMETSVEDTKRIVQGLKHYYEKFHVVNYTEELLDKIVDLTDRYIKTKFFPDKALDIVDAVGAKVKLAGRKDADLGDAIEIISKVSKVSADMVDVEKKTGYKELDHRIKQVVYGQENAVDTLVESIIVAKAGLREPNKPIGSFLFVGPTGTGKTETARALATNLESVLIKFDMSEYQERHSVAKLIGAPPGYVGHAEGKMGQGQLIAQVEENPNCVLLLDEVEKAAPEVLQILLQVMDDGKLTGSGGKEVDFSNVILLMTSNLGAADSEKLKIGFGDQSKQGEVSKAIERFFTPEFRNRLDSIVQFNKLDKSLMSKIVIRLIEETNELLKNNGSDNTIQLTDAAVAQLSEDGYEPSMGARPLKRVFEDNIKKQLSRKILFDDLSGATISIDYVENEYVLSSLNV